MGDARGRFPAMQRAIAGRIADRDAKADFADLNLIVVIEPASLTGLQSLLSHHSAVATAQILDHDTVVSENDHAVLAADTHAVEFQLAIIASTDDVG